jgi:hypothetical protein
METHALDVACALSRNILPRRNWQRNIPPHTGRATQTESIASLPRSVFRNRVKRRFIEDSKIFDRGVCNSNESLSLSIGGLNVGTCFLIVIANSNVMMALLWD